MQDERNDATIQRLAHLETEIRIWRWSLAARILGSVSLQLQSVQRPGSASAQEAAPRIAKPLDPDAIYEQIHAKSHQALALVNKTIEIGASVNDPSTAVAVWSHRHLSADLYRCSAKGDAPRTADPEVYLGTAAGPADPERLKAFQEHVARMKTWEARFERLDARKFLDRTDLLEIQFRRLQAEAWESRELNKARK